jgi:hypothetical protein
MEAHAAAAQARRLAAMAERVVRRAVALVADAPSVAPPPLGIALSGRGAIGEDDEDGEDEYRAPYLACQMSRVHPRTPGHAPHSLLGKWQG